MRRALAGCAVGLFLQATALAQVAPPDPRYTGHYTYEGTAADGRRRIESALRPALGSLNPLFRAIARGRLREPTRLAREIIIRIDEEEDLISIRYVTEDRARTWSGRAGYPRRVRGDDGRDGLMTLLFRDGRLEQVVENREGRLYNIFRLRDDTRLIMTVVIVGPYLRSPIRYSLGYRRSRSG